MKVYLCGPINGRSDDDCTVWREYAKSKLPNTLDPMRRDYRGMEDAAWREIVELDKIDVAQCDALLVYFDKPSVGTSMEMIWAWERGKFIVVMQKFAHVPPSPWLRYHSHRIVHSLDDACDALADSAPQPIPKAGDSTSQVSSESSLDGGDAGEMK